MERFDVAAEIIQEAGKILRRCHLEQAEISQKTGHQDLVTFWDRKIEQQLRHSILTAFPQDSIVGEEYPPQENCDRKVTWYLDPIDGTTNFINQHQNYAISMGCWEGADPLFGYLRPAGAGGVAADDAGTAIYLSGVPSISETDDPTFTESAGGPMPWFRGLGIV